MNPLLTSSSQTLIVALSLLIGCAGPDPQGGEQVETMDSTFVASEVEAAVWAFHAADTAMNAEAVIDLLWPEFYMVIDGKRMDYDAAVSGAREFMPGLEVFATEWTDLQVTPLGSRYALASFVFRDSIVTKTGDVLLHWGPNTFVWERRNREWRVLYTDADHYAVEE